MNVRRPLHEDPKLRARVDKLVACKNVRFGHGAL
jgi:hypothetical protein